MTPLLAFAGLFASYAAAETFSLTIEKTIIRDPQLPPAFHNLRIIFISDIHHGPFSNLRRLQNMVKRINRIHPDLILYGGDYLQTRHRPRQRQITDYLQLLSVLQKLDQPALGSFAVLGNHDYDLSRELNAKLLAQANITLLHNQGVTLQKGDHKIRLDGVGDMWYGHPDFHAAHGHTPLDTFTILLSHQPNFIDRLTKTDGVNLVLAGHTHGSQITFFRYQPFLPRRIAKWEYKLGLVDTDQAKMLVSPGIGNEMPYFRFFSPPKIHLITLKTEQKH